MDGAGVLGTLIVLCTAWHIFDVFRRDESREAPPAAPDDDEFPRQDHDVYLLARLTTGVPYRLVEVALVRMVANGVIIRDDSGCYFPGQDPDFTTDNPIELLIWRGVLKGYINVDYVEEHAVPEAKRLDAQLVEMGLLVSTTNSLRQQPRLTGRGQRYLRHIRSEMHLTQYGARPANPREDPLFVAVSTVPSVKHQIPSSRPAESRRPYYGGMPVSVDGSNPSGGNWSGFSGGDGGGGGGFSGGDCGGGGGDGGCN